MRLKLAGAMFCASVCFAQHYEIGGLIGYGIYRDVRVNSEFGEAAAGIGNRFVAGAVACEDLYEHFSGEIRYVYQDGDPFLSMGSVKGNIQGQSHGLSYDVLYHPRVRDQRFRPFLAMGIGAKYYRTTGPAPDPSPVPQIASLIHTNQWIWQADPGFGVKYRLHRHVIVRGDFRDYITPFPKKLFAPTGNATDRGLFQQFTLMFGLGYSF